VPQRTSNPIVLVSVQCFWGAWWGKTYMGLAPSAHPLWPWLKPLCQCSSKRFHSDMTVVPQRVEER
jgi:hypothetical protein